MTITDDMIKEAQEAGMREYASFLADEKNRQEQRARIEALKSRPVKPSRVRIKPLESWS